MYLDALQNGSDIRGIALDYQDKKANLTPKQLEKIAIGIVRWLENNVLASKCKRNQLKIGIGHDSRITADSLKQTLIDTFLHLGIQVIDFQLATTPAMFMATQFSQYNCDATIMITASHLPYYFNGLKIFTKKGGAEKKGIQYILTHHESLPGVKGGTILTTSLLDDYADDLIHKIKVGIHTQNEKPLAGYKIIVDAGNGAGGFFVEKVLKPLGANTEGSQFLDPDGMFPNHIPNPDNEETMHSIQASVLKQQADLGIIFDTDVDRSAIVDANGQVINKMIELNNQGIQTELAIETSGHAAFKENYCLDDGAYVVAKLLMLLQKLAANHQTLGELIATLKQPAEVHELRFQIKANDVQTYGNQIISDLEVFIQQQKDMVIDPENEEGIRTNVFNQYGNGWFLLRMSLHEPLLVLQIENDKQTKNRHVLKTLEPFFQQFYQLDDKALKNYLHQK
ncbi:phosphomannomutase/phosphoglucomutase AlgC [Melissococcus plutonius]|nr:phosphomannomutase/phosphoglucomutase AlgC [Melissococcus plutonius S1]KMT24770.1 phosphomannomutase/phosphoglucomutase AlgC [Melissococcus plutonius]KMT26407.1 phosphomannomutase/phosphoglucomutase AlgC [Melissococcus plutonius]KMT27657.1 phosphomannomutase/phosphoglucomutase AlgC [Melissococcus plutonius]KMT29429.1 phosphomannomutase/phosphoglucomutase AlgC [Melissococcus plutonius]